MNPFFSYFLGCTLLATVTTAATAQTFKEWQDLEVNAVNRLPLRANYFAYESVELAKRGDRQASRRYRSLNGLWKFNWVKEVAMRPTDFYGMDYNDKGWGTMPVPGLWELNGYGDPLYVNWNYAWKGSFKNNPPFVPEENNHVGSYRKEVVVPSEWEGEQIIAHFGSVTSNIYLWVNGKFVGYSEDSKLEAEFDLTPYLKAEDAAATYATKTEHSELAGRVTTAENKLATITEGANKVTTSYEEATNTVVITIE